MNNNIKNSFLCYCFPVFLFFAACGIEDYPYIQPIPVGNIQRESNSRVTVRIPGNNASFTHYTIFYKIYVSDQLQLLPEKINFNSINPTLNSDYLAIEPYIDNNSMGSSTMDSLFSQRNFYKLELEGRTIDNTLDNSAFGDELIIFFPQIAGDTPTISVGGNTYRILRYNGGGVFTPRPENNRYFINNRELYDVNNINENTNADVIGKAGSESFAVHHTYALMFIVGTGLNTATYNQLYSTPAFLHVLRLSDPIS